MLNVTEANKIAEWGCEEVVAPLTSQLKSIANQAGWEEPLVNALSVDYDNAYNLSISYPEDMATTIEDKEWSDLNGLPNAAMRPFAYRSPVTVAMLIADEVVGRVFEAMEVE